MIMDKDIIVVYVCHTCQRSDLRSRVELAGHVGHATETLMLKRHQRRAGTNLEYQWSSRWEKAI